MYLPAFIITFLLLLPTYTVKAETIPVPEKTIKTQEKKQNESNNLPKVNPTNKVNIELWQYKLDELKTDLLNNKQTSEQKNQNVDQKISALELKIDTHNIQLNADEQSLTTKYEAKLNAINLEKSFTETLQQHIDWWIAAFAIVGIFVPWAFTRQKTEMLSSQLNEVKKAEEEIKNQKKEIDLNAKFAVERLTEIEHAQKNINNQKIEIDKQSTLISEQVNTVEKLVDKVKQHESVAAEYTDKMLEKGDKNERNDVQYETKINSGIEYSEKSNQENDPLIAFAEESYTNKDFKTAAILYKKLTTLHPDNYTYWFNLAFSTNSSNESNQTKKISLLEEEQIYYQHSIKLNRTSGAYNNLGYNYSELAQLKPKPEKIGLFEQAIKQYNQAIILNNKSANTYINLGYSYSELAHLKPDPEKTYLRKQVIKQYQKAISLDKNNHNTYNNLGVSYFNLAILLKSEPEKATLFKQALDAYHNAENIKEGHASYNIACVYSLEKNETKAKKWLLKSQQFDNLPDKNHLEADTDLDNIRDLPWFKDLLAKM